MIRIPLNIQKFASGSFECNPNGPLQCKVEWSSEVNGSTQVEKSTLNRSTITVKVYARRTDSTTTTGTFSGWACIENTSMQGTGTRYGSISNSYQLIYTYSNTVSHNSNGSKSVTIYGSVTGPSGTSLAGKTSSGNRSITLDTIPRYATINNATNFTDEENPSFTYSNPAGLNNLRCWLEINPTGEHLAERNITSTATSGTYTWELTEEERNKLRAKIPNSNSATCRIGLYSTLGGSTQASFKDMTFTIVNGNPVFNNFEFEDINSTTLALTGDSSKNVNGYSTIQATISTLNKATAQKGASMSKYRLVIGDKTTDITYSDSASVNGNITNAPNGTYQLYAIDSRNNSTLITKLASQEITYTPINFVSSSCKVERSDSGVGQYAVLTINGEIWNNNFGQVLNSIQSVVVEYKETSSSTWLTSPTSVSPTLSGNTFSFTGQVASQSTTFELNKSYDFRITISDELSTKTIQLTPMASAVPNISLADNGVGIMCDYDDNLGGLLQVGGEIIKPLGKLLWSGSFTSGNITAKGANNFNIFIIHLAVGGGGGVYCIGSRNYGIGGIGQYGSFATTTYNYRLAYDSNTEKFSITTYDKGGSNGTSQEKIDAIYGLF